MNTEQIKEFGECRIGGIEIITIIGEIEGHEGSSGTAKTTKYEHLLPMLAAYDENSEIKIKKINLFLFLIRLAVMFPVDWHLPR